MRPERFRNLIVKAMSKVTTSSQTAILPAAGGPLARKLALASSDGLLFAGLFSLVSADVSENMVLTADSGADSDAASGETYRDQKNSDALAALIAALSVPAAQAGTAAENKNAAGLQQPDIANDLKVPARSGQGYTSPQAAASQGPQSSGNRLSPATGMEMLSADKTDTQKSEIPKPGIAARQNVSVQLSAAVLSKAAQNRGRSIGSTGPVARNAKTEELGLEPNKAADQTRVQNTAAFQAVVADADGMQARTAATALRLADPQQGQSRAQLAVAADAAPAVQAPSGQHSHGGGAGLQSQTSQSDQLEQWADMLDMADDSWADRLVQRVKREFRAGGKGLELELNPRQLGRLQITMSQQQSETHIHMRTETQAAAHLLNEAEARLAQILESSGLKLGQFSAHADSRGNGTGQGHAQNNRQEEQSGKGTDASPSDADQNYGPAGTNSETRVNIHA